MYAQKLDLKDDIEEGKGTCMHIQVALIIPLYPILFVTGICLFHIWMYVEACSTKMPVAK